MTHKRLNVFLEKENKSTAILKFDLDHMFSPTMLFYPFLKVLDAHLHKDK